MKGFNSCSFLKNGLGLAIQFLFGTLVFLSVFLFASVECLPLNVEKLKRAVPDLPSDLSIAIPYIDEHPQRALAEIEEVFYKQDENTSSQEKIAAFILLGRVKYNMGLYLEALIHIDSAEVLIQKENINSLYPIILGIRIDLLLAQNKVKEASSSVLTAIRNAQKTNNYKNLAEFYQLQGYFFKENKQFNEAEIALKTAIKTSEKVNDLQVTAEGYHLLGSNYYAQSKFEPAIKSYIKAKSIWEELQDTLGQVVMLRNLSLANREIGNFDLANSYLFEALTFLKNGSNRKLEGEIYNLLGSLSVRSRNSKKALEDYTTSLTIREAEGFLTSQAATIENIARVHRDLGDFNEASLCLLKAIEIRKVLGDLRGIASVYNDMGNLQSEQGRYADALKHFLSSLKIRQELNLEPEVARSLTSIGLTYSRLKSHLKAIKYFQQALELIPEKTDPLGKAYVYILLGNTQRENLDPTNALESYSKALEYRSKTSNTLQIAQANRSIANAYSDIENFSLARLHLNQALTLLNSINDEKTSGEILNELGNIAVKEGKSTQAIDFFQRALNIFSKFDDSSRKGLCFRKIGEIQTELGNFSDAFENLNNALSIGYKTENWKLVELTHLALNGYYAAKGNYKEALQNYQLHIRIRDSLQNLVQQEAIWQARLDLELVEKSEEIKKIEGEVEYLRNEAKVKSIQLKQQKLIRNFLAIISLSILILALVSAYSFWTIRRNNKQLQLTNSMLAQSQSELQQNIQTKDKLFSIIAHDLRSPFNAILGLTDILSTQARTMSGEKVQELSRIINDTSLKLLNLIDNLLHWSRSQTGRLNLNPQKIPLGQLVAEVVDILTVQAGNKGVIIENRVDSRITAFADYDTISTVIRNLISNAIKYSLKNGVVAISAFPAAEMVLVTISDNGVGIDPENIGKLFRVNENITTKGTNQESGTGLGLIICKEFIEKNGGTISVDSKLNEGTRFTISLPK